MVRALPRGKGLPTSDPARGSLAFTPHAGLLRPACSRTRQTPWSVFQDGPLGAAVPASLTTLGKVSVRDVRERTGAGFPAPTLSLATGAPTPCPEGRGSCSSSAPQATAGEAVRSGRPKPSARPKPRPPAAHRADAGRPARMDGATQRSKREPPGGAVRRSPRNPATPPTAAGHPGGPEPAGPERFPPGDFKRF